MKRTMYDRVQSCWVTKKPVPGSLMAVLRPSHPGRGGYLTTTNPVITSSRATALFFMATERSEGA